MIDLWLQLTFLPQKSRNIVRVITSFGVTENIKSDDFIRVR